MASGLPLRILLGIGVVLVLGGLWLGLRTRTTTPSPAVSPAPLDPLENALAASVEIVVPDDSRPGTASRGSGTIVDADGYILTNFHVIGDKSSRRLYNRAGAIFVSATDASSSSLEYRAELVEADYDLDLALLRLVSLSGGVSMPSPLDLAALSIGDSDGVRIGDELAIIGFPGLGGSTVTLTRGIVSGFLPDEGWIKTDAEINPGNSGGTAINEAGELIGIPTAGTVGGEFPGKLGLVRPVNMAAHLLRRIPGR